MKKTLFVCASSVIALAATPALAQESAEGDAPLGAGDIIVTANRTASLLSDTPIAMSAIGGDQLADEQILDPTQLNELVPNIAITRGNGLQITIRGVTSTDQTEKGDPSAAFNLNGIYIARPQQQETSFFDVERVEVLRGPQGTLYGRNATAGVINVISARPKYEFGASLDVNYGNFDKLNATGVLNVPASDTLAFRLAGNVDQRDSYIIDGAPDDGVDYNRFKNNKAVRLSALFEPTSDLAVYLVGDYSRLTGDNVNTIVNSNFVPASNFYEDIGTTPPLTNARYINTNNKAQRTNPTPFSQQPSGRTENWGITGEITYNFGPASVTYLGGYRETDAFGIGVLTNGARQADTSGDYNQQSHELRFAYNDGPLQAQVGGYYFREESDITLNINRGTGENVGRLSFLQGPTTSQNKSVFGQFTYELMPRLRATGGIRYSHDKKSRVGRGIIQTYSYINSSYDFGVPVGDPFILTNNQAERSFSKVTWRAGLDYDTDLGLIYASVSTGYKAGGFNDGCLEGTLPGCTFTQDFLFYEPETLTAYEAGFKFAFGPAFALNGTVFHYDYSNMQLTELVLNLLGPGQNGQITTNAATSKVDGVELDATLRPSDRWTFNVAFNYLDARYATFNPGQDLSGRPLTRSPKYSGRMAANYSLPVGDGVIDFNAATRFSSSYDLSSDFSTYRFFEQPGYTKTDLSVTYKAPDSRYYLGAYVENLENNLIVTVANAPQTAVFSDPRTYGLRAGVKF
ncbi:TonB-dependent receptor [Novosphingobium profundi]|uniref:TonB-dependent receptor n=1 Tax=Novosphingobium profundi TaxID=1774954 RepID=UPI001CFE3226|nr:TonB-dependent receptor [Novosphingobium profundi]